MAPIARVSQFGFAIARARARARAPRAHRARTVCTLRARARARRDPQARFKSNIYSYIYIYIYTGVTSAADIVTVYRASDRIRRRSCIQDPRAHARAPQCVCTCEVCACGQ